MLVDINLLPQKEPKKIAFIITLSCLILIFIVSGAYYLLQVHNTKSDIASVDRQLTMTKKIEAKVNNSQVTAAATNSAEQLKAAIKWADSYPIQTVPVMDHLTSLLPERGFIQSFGYTEAGTISLTVQFDSERDAAYFLENLNSSKWIQDVNLSALTAASTSITGATAATNQTADQSNAANTSNAATATNTNLDATTNSGTSNSTAVSADNNTQTTTAAGQTGNDNAANTTGTTVNTAIPTAEAEQNSTNVLPRYTGQFEITLNKDVVKESISKSKNGEKGVAGS